MLSVSKFNRLIERVRPCVRRWKSRSQKSGSTVSVLDFGLRTRRRIRRIKARAVKLEDQVEKPRNEDRIDQSRGQAEKSKAESKFTLSWNRRAPVCTTSDL